MTSRAQSRIERHSAVVDIALALFIGAALVALLGFSGLSGVAGGALLLLAGAMIATSVAMLVAGFVRSKRARRTRRDASLGAASA